MDADILILGGGPGGLSTALHLAKYYPHLTDRILILEKAHYPRPKLCAGGLTADAENILQNLGLDVSEIPHVDAGEAHFDFAGRGIKISNPRGHTIRIIRRDEFDAWLAKQAENRGIEIGQGITVKNIQPREKDVAVETDAGTFTAQIVVGADGSNGVTRRCIFPNAPVYTARTLEILTPTQPKGRLGAYFDFFPVPENIAGYVWDFPTQVKGEAMRCRGVYDTNLLAGQKRPPLKEPLAKEMHKQGFNLDDYEIKGHPIRWYDPSNPVAAPRVLLVGDAAGTDPIFGEGISIALGYGAVAAREIGESIRRNEFSFGGYRRRLAWSGLGQTLFARWLIAQVIYSFKWRWFQILLWRVLKPVVVVVAWVFVLNWSKRMR
jgi:flavin-dependent dehydrogenase